MSGIVFLDQDGTLINENEFAIKAREWISRFPSLRILVVGDLMLDEYLCGSVGRISPEAPVPVVKVIREKKTLGGAANVALNIAGLGARVEVVGVVGNDAAGREITQILRKQGIGVAGLVRDDHCRTTVKTRVVARSQQIVRVDREDSDEFAFAAVTRHSLEAAIRERANGCVGIVLSDYLKGTLTSELVEKTIAIAKSLGIFVAVDPKRTDFAYYRGCTLITPNLSEAEAALGKKELAGDLEIGEGGKVLLRHCGAKAVLITRGEGGMTLVERRRRSSVIHHIPAITRQVYDVTGAGDTVIGTFAVAFGSGASMREAALIANTAAAVVVGETGTVPITTEKLLRAISSRERESRGQSTVAGSSTLADPAKKIIPRRSVRYLCAQLRREGKKIAFTNGCFDVLHAGHAQYLQEASSLGRVLVVGLNSDASVRRLKGLGRPVQRQADRAYLLASLQSVSYVVIFSENTPAALIEEVVPDVLVKGGDWSESEIVGSEFVKGHGGSVQTARFVAGKSTTSILDKIVMEHKVKGATK